MTNYFETLISEKSASGFPQGFIEVTKDQFFKYLKAAASIDPMPRTEREFTSWETQKGPRKTWGWSSIGWHNSGPQRYAIAKSSMSTIEDEEWSKRLIASRRRGG